MGTSKFGLSLSTKTIVFVIQYFKKAKEEEAIDEDEEETSPAIIMDKVSDITNTMVLVDKDKPNLLVPIYGKEGNLLWPKQMSYAEVKRFVAERDANREHD